jgi:hypothetical protein
MYEKITMDYVILRFRLPAGPDISAWDCIRLFGEEVLPQFPTQ